MAFSNKGITVHTNKPVFLNYKHSILCAISTLSLVACSGGDTIIIGDNNDKAVDNENKIKCSQSNKIAQIKTDEISIIEAENYDTCSNSFFDTSDENTGEAYRQDSVDISANEFSSNGYSVTDLKANEYLQYSINVDQSGFYKYSFKTSEGQDIKQGINFSVNGKHQENGLIFLAEGEQVLKIAINTELSSFDYFSLNYSDISDFSANTVVQQMGLGINLGNLFEVNGDINSAFEKSKAYFSLYKQAGFKHVRIPISWGQHTQADFPYRIAAEHIAKVEELVDLALAENLYVIINTHHEEWLKADYSSVTNQERFTAIWQQIASHYQNKSKQLIFEVTDEPYTLSNDEITELNANTISTIRESNNDRLIIISGKGFTHVDDLSSLIPTQDENLIASFHSYDPYPFAGLCERAWGSDTDYENLEDIYKKASQWSINNNIPVIVSEFGVGKTGVTNTDNICDNNQRLSYLSAHIKLAQDYNFAASIWDDGINFTLFNRETLEWSEDITTLFSND